MSIDSNGVGNSQGQSAESASPSTSSVFRSIRESIPETSTSAPERTSDSDQNLAPDVQNPPIEETMSPQQEAEVTAAIAELEKMPKFKFEGQEWTPEDLRKAILRQRDYTKKTQELAEQKKAWETSQKEAQKFDENIDADIERVLSNPSVYVKEFMRVYPQKYHSKLQKALERAHREGQSQTSPQPMRFAHAPEYVDLLSQINELRSGLTQNQTKRHETSIDLNLEKFGQKYPDANTAIGKQLVLARLNDMTKGDETLAEIPEENWDSVYKAVDQEMKELFKSRYGDLVRKQSQANAKGRDVASGGGTPTKAPEKFKSFKEARQNFERRLDAEGR